MRKKQIIITCALLVWGILSALVFMSDESPLQPMDEQSFYLTKLLSLVSLALCELARRFAKAKGYIYK